MVYQYVTVLWHFYIVYHVSYSLERFNTGTCAYDFWGPRYALGYTGVLVVSTTYLGLSRPIPALCLIPICFQVEIPHISEVELGFEGFVEPDPALYALLSIVAFLLHL